jgi:hypothetical protein
MNVMNDIHHLAMRAKLRVYLLPLRAGGGREGVVLSALEGLHPTPTLPCCTQEREFGHTGGIS